MMKRRVPAASALVAAAVAAGISVLAVPNAALAYVRTRTPTSVALAWSTTCVPISGYPRDLPGLAADRIAAAIAGAAAEWDKQNPALAGCTYLDLQVTNAAPTAAAPLVQNDHVNVVVLQTDGWSYDPSSLALTTVTSRISNGQIIDADIQVNAFGFQWGDLVATPADTTKHDLQDALAHEMGHLVGLDHNCLPSGGASRPSDQNGVAIPDCDGAPQAVRDATMFPELQPGGTSRRTLGPDEQQAICDVYPLASDPRSCPAVAPDGGSPDAPTGSGGNDGSGGAGSGGASGAAGSSATSTGGANGTGGSAVDAGATDPGGGGCGCRATGARDTSAGGLFVATLALLAVARRHRPRSQP